MHPAFKTSKRIICVFSTN